MTANENRSPLRSFTTALLFATFLLSAARNSQAQTVYLGTSTAEQEYFISDSYFVNEVDIGSSTSLAGRIPLLLIHGINAEADGGYDSLFGIGATYSSMYRNWSNFIKFIRSKPELAAKYKVYGYGYRSNEEKIPELAYTLGTLMQMLQKKNPELTGKPIVVVAHSMGGLVAREFMRMPQNGISGVEWNERVTSLVTLGTPHHGTPLNNNSKKVFGALGDKLSLSAALASWELNGVFQLFGGSDWNDSNRSEMWWDNYDSLFTYNGWTRDEDNVGLKNLNTSRQNDQKIVAYAGTIGAYPVPSPSVTQRVYKLGDGVLAELGFSDSDGVVPSVSALFDGHTASVRPLVAGYDHSQLYLGKGNPETDPHFIRIGQDLEAIAATLTPPSPFDIAARPDNIGTTPRVLLSRTEAHGATGYQVFRNDQPLGTFASGSREFWDNSVSAGTSYSYYVEASNASGQKTLSRTLQITAPNSSAPDNAAPGFPVNLSAFPRPWARNNQFNVAWNNPPDPSGISKVRFKLGSAPTSATEGAYLPLPQFNPFPISMTRQEGSQLIYVWLEDGRGNKSHLNAASTTLQLDVTRPTVSITSHPTSTPISTPNNSITLSGPYADSLSGVSSVTWQNTTTGTGTAVLAGTPNSGTWTASSITLYPGANLIKVRAVDAAGNEANTTLTVNYLDTSNSGTLGVGIQPQGAVDAGAQWRLVGESAWRASGGTASGVATGSRIVEFKAVDGWITPLPATISVLANQIVTLPLSLGTYVSGTANQAPDEPSNPYPLNGEVNIARSGLTLRWSGGHPTGSPDFAVAFGTVNPPGFVAWFGAVPGRTYNPTAIEPLLPATTYYWSVRGKVGDKTRDGPVWRFTTDYSYADLIPYEIAVDGNIQPGATVTVRVKVKNQGTFTSSSACWLNLYLSQTPQGRERRISQFNTIAVPVLVPGAEVELQQTVKLNNLAAGQSFIDAWVDSAPYGVNERDYENNVQSLAIQYVDGQSPVITAARLTIPYAKTGQSNSIFYSATDDVGVKTMDFYYSTNGGVNWVPIQEGHVPPVPPVNGVIFPWVVPTSLPQDTNLLVRVVARDATGNWGETNTIAYPILNGTAPTVAMLSPNGGEAWDMNSTQTIRWSVVSANPIAEMKLWFYFGNGNSLVVADIQNNTTGQYTWTLPNNLVTANGRIRIEIRDNAGNANQDSSDTFFTIRDTSAPPPAPWTTPELLTLVPAQDVGSKNYGQPKLATDANGNAHLIYKYSNDTGALNAQRTITQTIFYRKRTGTTWSAPTVAYTLTQVPDANGRSIYGLNSPQVAIDTNGCPHLLWTRIFELNENTTNQNSQDIYYTRFNGTSWEAPLNLTETIPGIESRLTSSHSAQIQIDAGNNVHVVWRDGKTLNPDSTFTGTGNIYYRTNSPALGWSAISQVTVTDHVRELSLSIDQSNRLHLSYITNSGTILYQSLAGQGWTTPETVAGTGPVFLNSQANAYPHLVWQYFDSVASLYRVAYSRHDRGLWSPGEFVSSGVPNVGQSKVLMDSFGRAHVLMEGSENGLGRLFHKRREPLGWTSPIRLHLPSQNLANTHSDAVLSPVNNEMHVVFAASPNGHLELFYNHASFASTNDIYPPAVAVDAPSPGTLASVGSSLNLQWSALDDSVVSSIHLHYTTNGGATWLQIATNLPNSGTNVWIVPNLVGLTVQVRVSAADALGNTGYGFSGNFTTVDVTPPDISISAPVPPAVLTGGSTTNIVWTATDNVGVARVHVDYSLDNGATWIAVATNLANTGTYPWIVPAIPTSILLLRATAQDAAGFSASFSSQPLTIVRGNYPPLAPASPFPPDGSSFVLTQLPNFRWNSSDPDGDSLTYYVRFGSNTNAPFILTTTNSFFSPPALRPQRTYYWQVLATDGKATNTGSLWWSFTTEAGTLPPTSLAEFKRQTSGQFEFRFNGLFGENQVVQASTNLFDWFTVATFGSSNAASVFLDSAATNLNRRFYRVIVP